MNRKRFLVLFLFVFLLAACQPEEVMVKRSLAVSGSTGATEFYGDEAPAAEPTIGANFGGDLNDGLNSSTVPTNFNPAQQTETQERLMIRTGNMDIVVEDTEASLADIGRLAERLGGWIVTSEVRQTTQEAKAGSVTIRIPADQYDEIVSQVKEMALEVTWESSSSQDVTDEFVDLSSRLGNLEATAERVRAFLDEATDVEEALAVNRELSRLEGEIEVIKGQMQYLSQSAAFSTLTITLTPDAISQPIEVAGWRPEGTAKDAIETLVRTLQSLADVAIVAALYFLPMALIIGIPAYFIFRFGRNFLRRRKGGETAVASE